MTAIMPKPISGNIYLKGYLDLPEERVGAIMPALETHVVLTRAEEGCIYFSVTANADIPNRLNVEEIFVDQAAFDHHQQRAGASVWADVSKGIERHFDIVDVA